LLSTIVERTSRVAQLPDNVDRAELTVVARRVLLDALEALGPHRDAVVLVGAQAIYQHTATAELGVAAYTSDGDLGLDPAKLGDEPLIEAAMIAADFSREQPDKTAQPGIWWKRQIISGVDVAIEVDLLVPAELSPGTRRSVSLPPHDRMALHRVQGLGVAMEDHERRAIASLEPTADPRVIEIEVAGVAALLVAKAHKLGERFANDQRPDRLLTKDASDVLGLMIASEAYEIAATFERLLTIPRVADTTRQGLRYLDQLFGTSLSPGVQMAIAALRTVKEPASISTLAPAYVAILPSV
jgi:hypothetical protein